MISKPPSIEGVAPTQNNVNKLETEADSIRSSRKWDPNLSQEKVDAINEASKTGDQEKAVELEKSELQDSPYESVRAAVRNTDNGEVANTVRAWVLGMVFVTIGSGLNMFLSMRYIFP